MTEQVHEQGEATSANDSKKLSNEAIGMILLFAAIPLIAYIKWVYDDNVGLGAIASILLGGAAIFLRKKFG